MIERKNMELHLFFCLMKEKNIPGAADFGAAARSWLSYPTINNNKKDPDEMPEAARVR